MVNHQLYLSLTYFNILNHVIKHINKFGALMRGGGKFATQYYNNNVNDLHYSIMFARY